MLHHFFKNFILYQNIKTFIATTNENHTAKPIITRHAATYFYKFHLVYIRKNLSPKVNRFAFRKTSAFQRLMNRMIKLFSARFQRALCDPASFSELAISLA